MAARLFVTPARAAPGPGVRAVVHLRGLAPNSPVEVQINPPAPNTAVLADVHTRASARGMVDQPVTFAALGPGAYIVFVNLGAYADPRSALTGASLRTVLPVAASWPLISFPCGAPLNARVACQLSGYGFHAHEQVSIIYDVSITTAHGPVRTVYRRASRTDGAGSFARPTFWFRVDPREESSRVTVTVQGARGDRATVSAIGIAQ